ncbi:kinase-like protein [Auricularia subglabra TFB-10046 SS5]|nr:kinase-like protein [Auricularia subglabra TFB-10046 SS5]
MRYNDIVHIVRYSPTFSTAGGAQLPKISYCEGSDGRRYKQLFKGEGTDDLRQDAVIRQVFSLCNKFLGRDREATKRNLFIRTYKVVPLSPKAGMLEFVEDTMPLGTWLRGAHRKYRPDEPSAEQAQRALKEIHDKFGVQEVRNKRLVEAFTTLQGQIQPVLRFAFYERHKDPMAWFAMRLRYARSVAASSIAGHILGLGDRHAYNILMDERTGDLVHIDLGIALDHNAATKGKTLPIPETVPFRLTADIVDGLGITGVEGAFRRCAEHTLRVLRDNGDLIKIILEVLKRDPLHTWYPKVKLRQAERKMAEEKAPVYDRFGIGLTVDSDPELEAADRALSGVARKLDKSLSVECVVDGLIREATDPENLSRMFWGELIIRYHKQ